MKVDAGAIPVESNAPFRGLLTSIPSTRIEGSFSPKLLNVVIREGVVRRRAGYLQLGQDLVGEVLQLVEPNIIHKVTGALINPLVALTSKRQYRYDDTAGESKFVDITPGQDLYALVGVTVGTSLFEISGDYADEFLEDFVFPVVGSTDNDGVYTVSSDAVYNGVSGNTEITVDETIPSGDTVDGDIILADEWSQTGTDGHIDYVAATDVNSSRLLITNGAETMRQWDGEDTFENWIPDFGGPSDFQWCKTLALHFDHLFMGGIVVGTSEPTIVAWSDVGNFDQFADGTAGVQILTGVIGEIRAMVPLGDRLAIYSNDSIITAIFVGLPAIFAFETVIPSGTRFSSAKSILPLNVGHVWPSEQNFYLFDGSRGMRTVGEPIKDDYKENKDFEHIKGACALNDFSRRTLFLSFPDTTGEVLTYTAFYDPFDLSQFVWAKERYADKVTAFGFYTKQTLLATWEDTPEEQRKYLPDFMPWEDEVGPWFSESEQVGFPTRVFGTDTGKVFLVTETVDKDNGVAFTSTYETPDFSLQGAFLSHIARWVEVEFEASGTSVVVARSTDLGRTFVDLETVALTSELLQYVIPFDVSSRTVRFRFTIASGMFELRWIRAWAMEGGAR